MSRFLYLCQGSEIRFSCLCDKNITDWANSLTPETAFLRKKKKDLLFVYKGEPENMFKIYFGSFSVPKNDIAFLSLIYSSDLGYPRSCLLL